MPKKVEILKEGYFAARDYDAAIRQVTGTLLDVDHRILVANSEGVYAQDRQIRTRLAISRRGGGQRRDPDRRLPPGRRMGLRCLSRSTPRRWASTPPARPSPWPGRATARRG